MEMKDMHRSPTTLEMQDESPKKKINRTRIAVAAILVTLGLGIVILVTVLLTRETGPKINDFRQALAQRRNIRGIEMEDILSKRFDPDCFNGTFVSGTEILFRSKSGDRVLFDVTTKETEIIVDKNHPILKEIVSYELSADRKYLMVSHHAETLYRFSLTAQYDILDLATNESKPLTSTDGSLIHLQAIWSPVGNAIAFVSNNTYDIYYKPSVIDEPMRVTNSGVPGVVFNGVPDWVNLGRHYMWFSPDGSKLAFAKFNDSQTRIMSIPFYGIPSNLDFQYTRAVNIRYPKPGTPNPTVTLHVTTLTNPSAVVDLPYPTEIRTYDPLLSTVTWAGPDQLIAVWMNRVQNQSYMMLCETIKPSCRNILEMKESRGWITLPSTPKTSTDGKKVILILPQKQEPGGNFRHVCVAELGENQEFAVRALTHGRMTVTEIVKYNDQDDIVYFLAVEAEHPEVQHLYEVAVNGSSPAKCITCDMKTRLQKRPCLYNTAKFSKDGNYALNCEGPGIPETTLRDKNHNKIMTWTENQPIYEDLRSRQLPIVERMKVPIPGGFEAVVQLSYPPDIDRSGKYKYPLLVDVYGGPDSAQASEKFQADWSTYLTVNRSFIYATIDGRGSANKGQDMLFTIYKALRTYEIEDQITVTKEIQKKLPFVDKTRTAIWGWSYGGYATIMALIQDTENVFKCGISVAPVTDWAHYNTQYTERYMGLPTPEDNLHGYTRAAVDKVENLRKKKFLLIHGTSDDNVLYQHSALLAKGLQGSNILFQQQSYTDEDHSLDSVRPHFFHTIETFLDDCYGFNSA